MRIGYFDCSSGISGDMTLGALVDAGVPLEMLDAAIRSLGIPELSLSREKVHRKAFYATKVNVNVPHEHVHRHLSDILKIISVADIPADAKSLAESIFRQLAEAEAKVHGTTIEEVHFHEVGAADSIADIIGVALGLHYLGLEAIYASAVPAGCGTISIAHGECSIPAPATAELLRGIPIAPSDVPFELTTPTGAAILAATVKRFGSMPAMSIQQIGYGAGGRDLEQQPNILRFFIGELISETSKGDEKHSHSHSHPTEEISGTKPVISLLWMLETNLDDIPGEMIGYTLGRIWELEPLDIFTTAIMMKKQRPGTKLSVLCRTEQIREIEQIIFEETGTLGIRRYPLERTELPRLERTIKTEYGEISAKQASLPDGSLRITPEYDSAAAAAERCGIPIRSVYDACKREIIEEEKPLRRFEEKTWND